MPTVLSNKQFPSKHQNIFQNQPKQTKNRESHGGVRPDKYADSRVHISLDQPVMDSDFARTPLSNTKNHRPKKRATTRRLSQLATWVEDPIVFKVQQKARKKGLSTSAVIRKLLVKALKDEESVDEALDTESLREAIARDNRRLARRLSWFLVWLLFDVGHIKVLATNALGMQKGMTQEMLKDILGDADRQTKKSLSRKRPELTGFIDEVEKWLVAEEGRGEKGA
jgi:hypothetical protein